MPWPPSTPPFRPDATSTFVARLLRALGKTALFVSSPLNGLGRRIVRVCARIERARKRIADIPLG